MDKVFVKDIGKYQFHPLEATDANIVCLTHFRNFRRLTMTTWFKAGQIRFIGVQLVTKSGAYFTALNRRPHRDDWLHTISSKSWRDATRHHFHTTTKQKRLLIGIIWVTGSIYYIVFSCYIRPLLSLLHLMWIVN